MTTLVACAIYDFNYFKIIYWLHIIIKTIQDDFYYFILIK